MRDLRYNRYAAAPVAQPPLRARLVWTIGNLLMLTGVYVLLYVGGVYTQIEYFRQAARGDSDLPAPQAVIRPAADGSAAAASAEPSIFAAPVLNSGSGRVSGSIPSASRAAHTTTVSRLIIPAIGVDSKVVEVGWTVEQQDGQPVALWEVAEYAVGQHRGSANPGEGGNVVLAGHVGGYGKVFKDLYYVKPGNQIVLYSRGQQYLYVVNERLLVDEENVPPEQRVANARLIEPTDGEVVTLVTCWPPTGPNKFSQRLIVRAVPYRVTSAGAPADGPASWTIR
jgi:LPXTG-site transpeptidase (sortase) family protein